MRNIVAVYVSNYGTLFSVDHGFSSNPISFSVPKKSSYHSNAGCTQPYSALNNFRYSTFFPCLSTMNFRYSSYASHMMSTDSPSTFRSVKSCIFASKYAPATSAVATSRRSDNFVAKST